MQQFKEYLEDEGLPSNEERIEFILPVIKNLDGKKLTSDPAQGRRRLQAGRDRSRRSTSRTPFCCKHPVALNWYPKIQSQQSKGVGSTSDIAVMEEGVFRGQASRLHGLRRHLLRVAALQERTGVVQPEPAP